MSVPTSDPWASSVRVDLTHVAEGNPPQSSALNGNPPRRILPPSNDSDPDLLDGSSDTDEQSSHNDESSQGAPSEGKSERPLLLLPPDVEPPNSGWPRLLLKIRERRQTEDPQRPGYLLVPRPNAAEQAKRDERDYVAAIAQTKELQRSEANRVGSGKMVMFINPKGNGSKTTQTIWTATGLCRETGAEVTVFDANYANGTAAQRLGFDGGGTLTERELIDNFGELSRAHDRLNEYLKNNPDRVRVLAATAMIEGGRKLTGEEYAKAAELIRQNCDFLYVDTPQDITSEQCLALIEMATVLVFVTNVGEQDSLRKLWEGMETLRSFGFRDKVNRSVVSIGNMPPGAKAADYRMYLNVVNVHNEVVRVIHGHDGPVVGVRHDQAIANAQPVVYDKLRRETAQDIRLLNTAILSLMPTKPALPKLRQPEYHTHTSSDSVIG